MQASRGRQQGVPRRSERRHWDDLARSLPDLAPAASTAYYRRCEIALIERAVGSLAGKRVLKLDLWNEALNTRILHWMQSRGAEAFGLDLSQVVTDRARSNLDGAHLVQADIRELPFAAASFDFVYTMGTIEHIAEYAVAVRELRRVLKPGGRAIVGVPHKWNLFLRPALVCLLDLVHRYPYSPEKSFSAGDLRRLVEGEGLRVLDRTGILTIPGIVRMIDLYCYRRGIALHRATRLFLRPFELVETRWRWPGRFGYLLALVVERA
jgi:SAM-dependent methyltransferase